MTKKTTIAAAALLFAGAGAIVLIKKDDATSPEISASKSSEDSAESEESEDSRSPAAKNSRVRERDSFEYPDLVERYGHSRTNLAKHVVSNMIVLLDDIISIEESQSPDLDIRTALGEVYDQLNLTDDQQAAAHDKLTDFRKRTIAEKMETMGKLKDDKTSAMRSLLASDAIARGEMNGEDINISKANNDKISINFNMGDFDETKSMGDVAFVTDFKALLSPEQAGTFQSYLDQKAAAATDDAKEKPISAGMELDKLDRTITATKEIVSAAKQMMSIAAEFEQKE